MDAARISPLKNRGDQLNASSSPSSPGPGPSGRAGTALEQGLGAGSEQPAKRDGKRDEGPRARSQSPDHWSIASVL